MTENVEKLLVSNRNLEAQVEQLLASNQNLEHRVADLKSRLDDLFFNTEKHHEQKRDLLGEIAHYLNQLVERDKIQDKTQKAQKKPLGRMWGGLGA